MSTMFCWDREDRNRARVARGGGELSPETKALVDEAIAGGRAGAERIKARAKQRAGKRRSVQL